MIFALRRLRNEFRSLVLDERGSYVVLIAFSLVGVMGFAAMGIDLAMWYQEKRTTQNIADAAAVAATHAGQRGVDLTEMAAAALADAIRNGYEAGPNNQVNVTASAGGPVGNSTPVVDVEVRRAVPLFVMSMFIFTPTTGSIQLSPTKSLEALLQTANTNLLRAAQSKVNWRTKRSAL